MTLKTTPPRALRRFARLYREYWRVNLLTTLEYRENFLLWFGFIAIYHGSALATLWLVLARFPAMAGWSFPDLFFLYALWMLAHALAATFFSTIGEIPEHIREGSFDRVLLRPMDVLLSIIVTPGHIFPDELILAILTFVVATVVSRVHIDLTFAIFVPPIVVGGALIDVAIDLAIATLAFWFVRVEALQWLALELKQEFTRYPLAIYTRGVRLALIFVVPFAFVNYFPAAYFLRKADATFGLPPEIGLAAPLVGITVFGLAYAFWRVGLRRYRGVGH